MHQEPKNEQQYGYREYNRTKIEGPKENLQVENHKKRHKSNAKKQTGKVTASKILLLKVHP